MNLKKETEPVNWKARLSLLKPESIKKKWNSISGRKKIGILLLFALAAMLFMKLSGGKAPQAAKAEYITEEAQRRSITESISGSGTLEPADSYTITTLVEGDILSADFEVGDIVEKDAVLCWSYLMRIFRN